MRKILTTTALVLVLSYPAFSGIMHTPGALQPEPTPTPTDTTQQSVRIDENVPVAADIYEPDALMTALLDAVASVLSLL